MSHFEVKVTDIEKNYSKFFFCCLVVLVLEAKWVSDELRCPVTDLFILKITVFDLITALCA